MKMNPVGESGANDGPLANDKNYPKDAQVMAAILKDMGITDYEPRVINQLLEFAYRYMTTVLEDARLVSSHAKKKAIDVDDIKLAVQMYTEENLTSPPSRDVLLETARTRNALPLPLPKPTCGLRLPPERFCVTASNYQLAHPSKKKTSGGRNVGSSFANQNNPNTPKILVAPPGATLIQQSSVGGSSQPQTGIAMPKFQIQTAGNQPVFSLTVNQPNIQVGLKRKAGEMDNGD